MAQFDECLIGAVLEVKLCEMEKRWNKLADTYEEYMTGKTEEDSKDDIVLRYDEASDKYEAGKAKLMELIKKEASVNKDKSTFRNSDKTTSQDMFQAVGTDSERRRG